LKYSFKSVDYDSEGNTIFVMDIFTVSDRTFNRYILEFEKIHYFDIEPWQLLDGDYSGEILAKVQQALSQRTGYKVTEQRPYRYSREVTKMILSEGWVESPKYDSTYGYILVAANKSWIKPQC